MIRLSDKFTIERALNPYGKQNGWLVTENGKYLFFNNFDNAITYIKKQNK